jgi:hypothetical protein
VGGWLTVLGGTYQGLLPAIAECAATLTGLLFVAMTVAGRHGPADRPIVIEQVRAASCILAFTNALAVSLFGLVPENNTGYPAVVMAVIGMLFIAAGTRSIFFSGRLARRHVPRQLGLLAVLLLAFASELAGGIALIVNPRSASAAELVGNVLVALLIIGIARAWELIGDRRAGAIGSIAILTGHDRNAPVTSSDRAPRPAETADDDDGGGGGDGEGHGTAGRFLPVAGDAHRAPDDVT